jgi:hypothetical protein
MMKKTRLRMDALTVEGFEPAASAATQLRGTVRGAQWEDTLVRSCQTQQFDCTQQGGYTCDYGSCVSGICCE